MSVAAVISCNRAAASGTTVLFSMTGEEEMGKTLLVIMYLSANGQAALTTTQTLDGGHCAGQAVAGLKDSPWVQVMAGPSTKPFTLPPGSQIVVKCFDIQ